MTTSEEKGKKGGQKGKEAKGKNKGKDKGKGKYEGKGCWKGQSRQEKGKSTWEESGARHVCGKQGHYAEDCWKRVQQVEDQPNPGGASSSSTGHTGGGAARTSSVKMVCVATPPDPPCADVFQSSTYTRRCRH